MTRWIWAGCELQISQAYWKYVKKTAGSRRRKGVRQPLRDIVRYCLKTNAAQEKSRAALLYPEKSGHCDFAVGDVFAGRLIEKNGVFAEIKANLAVDRVVNVTENDGGEHRASHVELHSGFHAGR